MFKVVVRFTLYDMEMNANFTYQFYRDILRPNSKNKETF